MTAKHVALVTMTMAAGLAVLSPSGCSTIAGVDGLVYDLTTNGGGQGGSAPTLTFTDDELDGEFGEGTFDGTAYNADHVGLEVGSTTGRFVSRVFDAGEPVSWVGIEWLPGAPYGKPLPDGAVAESGYPGAAQDMTDATLLWHFDGPRVSLQDGQPLIDGSAAGNDGVVAGGAALVSGRFGQAIEDDPAGYVFTPIEARGGLGFGTGDFTWSLWVRSTYDCPADNPPFGNRVYMGADESGGDSTHLWLGCTSSSSACPVSDGNGRAGGTFCSQKNPSSDCKSYCGGTIINDGQWHHLALVKQGHAPGTLTLYVDGRNDLDGRPSVAIDFEGPIDFPAGTEFTVGAFSDGTFQAAGTFDEAAVWGRALSAGEIENLYARGVLQLSMRVRVCQQPDCSDAPMFVGLGGDGGAYVDEPGALSPPAQLPLQGLAEGRYFQYEVSFESQAASPVVEPELLSVTIFAEQG